MANENEQPEDVQQLQDAASRQPQPDTGFMQQFQQPAPGGWGQEPDRAYLQSPQPDGPPVDEYQAAQARQNRQRQLQAYEEQRQAYADYLDRWNGNQGLLNGRAGRTSLNANNDIGDSGFTPSFPGQTRPGSPLIPGDARDDFVGIRPEVRPPSPIGGGRDAQQPGLSRYAVRMDDGMFGTSIGNLSL